MQQISFETSPSVSPQNRSSQSSISQEASSLNSSHKEKNPEQSSQTKLFENSDGWYPQSALTTNEGTEESSFCKNEQIITVIHEKFCQKDKPLDILSSNKYSLEPDMIFGWKPKTPTFYPMTLNFPNSKIDNLHEILKKDDRFRVVYRGRRYQDSIEVNCQHRDFYWKYRERYESQRGGTKGNLRSQAQSEYRFCSDFESGNLDTVVRLKPNEYDCWIRSDSNTKGHCNWYYFSVENRERTGELKLNICNIGKIKNLYNKGMKPFVLETTAQSELGSSRPGAKSRWSQHPCFEVEFVQRLCRYGTEEKRFELQFKYRFDRPNQRVYFAYAIPYTYTRLEKLIKNLTSQHPSICRSQRLCESIGGVNLPLLTITNDVEKIESINSTSGFNSSLQVNKKAIVLTARIHPGESHSSYVMEGFLKELLEASDCELSSSQSPQKKRQKKQWYRILREAFVFYIVPMLNPDGVIVGNYRTSYSGRDLNRQFEKSIDQHKYPEIYHLNDLVRRLRQRHFQGIQFYMDFHGHSSKKNMFSYGPEHNGSSMYYFKSRVFTKLVDASTEVFNYKQSIFKISEGKRKTARAHMQWKLNIPMVFTFEVSNGMYVDKNGKDVLLCDNVLTSAGVCVAESLYKYAKMEMKLPANILVPQTSVPKHIVPKRLVRSSKNFRTNENLGGGKGSKPKSIRKSISRQTMTAMQPRPGKMTQHIKTNSSQGNPINQSNLHSQKNVRKKSSLSASKKCADQSLTLLEKVLRNSDTDQVIIERRENDQSFTDQQDLNDFLQICNEVNKLHVNEEVSEGGSDSESDSEDFTGDQINNLFKRRLNGNNQNEESLSTAKKIKRKVLKNVNTSKKSTGNSQKNNMHRKSQISSTGKLNRYSLLQGLPEADTNVNGSLKTLQKQNSVMKEIQRQIKKYKTISMKEIAQESKAIKAINCNNLLLHGVAKSAQQKTLHDRPFRMGGMQNERIKAGIFQGLISRDNYPSQKLCKVPICQRTFNMNLNDDHSAER